MSSLLASLLVSMSVEALSWVFRHSKSRLAARLVLLALADFAQADGRDAFPSVATLAAKAGVSKRTARSGLRQLEETGEIARTGTSPYGTTVYAITLGAANPAGGAETGTEGRQKTTAAVSPSSPDPSVNPSGEPSSSSARKPALDQELPKDLPAEHRPALEAVWPVLERIARAKPSSVPPTREGVARAIASFPDRDHLDAATDLEQWLVHGTGRRTSIADIVQSYRRTLTRTRPRESAATAAAAPRRDFSRFDRAVRR